MKNDYDECLIGESELDDELLFAKFVIKEDYDLLTIDSLLSEVLSKN